MNFFAYIYIKMSKHVSAKYYPEDKERLQKSLWKILMKKKKKKSKNMVVNIMKIFQEMKNRSLLSIEKTL